MFKLTIHDREGVELKEGDIVEISDGKNFKFFSEVKYDRERKVLYPFHTFCFHSIVKVDIVPEEARPCNEERYKCWYLPVPNKDDSAERAYKYLMSWRECERQLNDRIFQITPLE